MSGILLSSRTVRLALNAASLGAYVDQLSGGAVSVPKADLRFEVCVCYHKVNTTKTLVDLSNWVSLTCTLKALVNNAAPPGTAESLAEKVVLLANMNQELTVSEWDAVTGYHAAFDFSEAEINALTGTAFWCVFTALLNTGKSIPVAFGQMGIVEDGYGIADPADVIDGTAYTKAEANALFAKDRNDITARTGGAANALDSIPTAGGAWAIGNSIRTRSGVSGGREEWILELGTEGDVEDPEAGIVKPDDFDAETNPRIWTKIL